MLKRLGIEVMAVSLAYLLRLRSEDPHRKVGAVALDQDNRFVALGYNGLPKDVKVDESFWLDRDRRRPLMIHAEVNCLSLTSRGHVRTLAASTLPCANCATAIAAHGVKKVLYCESYETDGNASLETFKFYGIEVQKISFSEVVKAFFRALSSC